MGNSLSSSSVAVKGSLASEETTPFDPAQLVLEGTAAVTRIQNGEMFISDSIPRLNGRMFTAVGTTAPEMARDLVTALLSSREAFVSAVRRASQHRSVWFDKQITEFEGVEAALEAAARVCASPISLDSPDSLFATAGLLDRTHFPNYSSIIDVSLIDGLHSIFSAAGYVQGGIDEPVIVYHGSGSAACTAGTSEVSQLQNVIRFRCLDDRQEPVKGLSPYDVDLVCDSKALTAKSVTIGAQGAVTICYTISKEASYSDIFLTPFVVGRPLPTLPIKVCDRVSYSVP